MRPVIVTMLTLCLTAGTLWAQEPAAQETFNELKKARWGTIEPTGGVDDSAYLKSKPGTYAVFPLTVGELEPGATYTVTMMVKTPTGAIPQLLPKITQSGLYLWHQVKRFKKMDVTDEWTEASFTFSMSKQRLEKFGDAMKKQFEKRKAKDPDYKPHALTAAWPSGKVDLDKPLTLQVVVYNWASDKRAKGDRIEKSVMCIDNLKVEKTPAPEAAE